MVKFKRKEVRLDNRLRTINTVTMEDKDDFLWIEKAGDLYNIYFADEEITFQAFQKGKKITIE